MMMIYSIFLFVFILIYHLNISFAQNPIAETQVDVRSELERQNTTNILWRDDSITTFSSYSRTNLYYVTSTRTYRPLAPATTTDAFHLIDSDCFCSYDQTINLLSCSPYLKDSFSYPLPYINTPTINVTLTSCKFFSKHLNLPLINGRNIDYLRLDDVNHKDYLVIDRTSFSSYRINHIYILCGYTQPITILLISNETFLSSFINLSLRTLYIDSCYLVTLNNTLNRLSYLESITLNNIEKFSWHDFQQEIIYLPNLRYIYIGEEISSTKNNIFNALSCQDILPQWILTYHLIQTCSCKLISFLTTIQHYNNISKCPNSDNRIEYIKDICLFNGKKYQIQNRPNLFCNKCLSYRCSNQTLCTEAYDSEPNCLLLSGHYYDTIRTRIPRTSYTKQFLPQESQEDQNINLNTTLDSNGFSSVATVLINSNRNSTECSSNDSKIFHETFAEMLDRPWAPEVYTLQQPITTASIQPPSSTQQTIWQELLISLDRSVQHINDSEPKFEFQSKPISTMSLHFSTAQQPQEIFGWQITNDNIITANITNIQSIDKNVTSRVFLKFNTNKPYKFNCNISNSFNNCTNRYSITSIKSQKLFYKTDRIPEYDVISITAPNQNQNVTFYFDQKISSIDTFEYSINITNSTTIDTFYDQLDFMILEGSCMYLNTTSMIWQTDGCFTHRQLSNSTSVICTCQHLTMFTVFFSLTCANPSKTVEIFSWIGCGLSIIGLSITLLMFIAMSISRGTENSSHGLSSSNTSSSQEIRRRIVNKPRHLSIVKSMLFILCILLILMNILIFILTFVKSNQNLSCKILSALLYYFTLSAFIWKLLFALQQSLFLTNTFQPQWSNRTLFTIYLILTFIIPICPLLVMFVKYKNSTFISSQCNYCWLTREFLLYGLIIPILIIICLNIILYLYTMIYLCMTNRQHKGLRSTKSEHSRRIQNFKIGLFFAIIMGFSWIFGFLVLIPNTYVQLFGNILFCVINSFQGFAFSIMVFFMIKRKSFLRCCCFWKNQNQIKTTMISQSIILQESLPTSNDNGNIKIKSIHNSSIHTSSTISGGDTNTHDIFDHYRHHKLPTEKETNEDEHIDSLPTL
ncbi:unnamed protein product [Rotaria sordida]|uniref:G-protein coupled receptors family 2 profile 2 domain-containing protein n=1 Tax=Rotaria sordida TaxID=392033 RepID=A0A818Z248_9BILA|nr:unnamed protein product [Rotaria sordida]CAF3764571.1 unnamed protein product [Rotaria sordida]